MSWKPEELAILEAEAFRAGRAVTQATWYKLLARQKAINDAHDKIVDLTPSEYKAESMSGMVERVARALAKHEGYAYDEFPYDAEARAAIEAMPSVWQTIDSAPKDGESFLGCRVEDDGTFSMRVVYYAEEGDFPWHVEDAGVGFNHHKLFFTHWMPLPEPPKAT